MEKSKKNPVMEKILPKPEHKINKKLVIIQFLFISIMIDWVKKGKKKIGVKF